MIHVILDSKCHQAIRHQGTEEEHYQVPSSYAGRWRERRLTGLKDALAMRGYALEISDFNLDGLAEAAILVIAGRVQKVPFSNAETETIAAFCNNGGSLLLMANHKGLVAPQNQIVEVLKLPIRFNETAVLLEKQQLILHAEHPISKNCKLGLHIRTSCTMTLEDCPSATVLAKNEDLSIGPFAVALEHEGQIRRRTVIMTSAGHISSDDDSNTDLWAAASNAKWTLNIIDWLAHRLAE